SPLPESSTTEESSTTIWESSTGDSNTVPSSVAESTGTLEVGGQSPTDFAEMIRQAQEELERDRVLRPLRAGSFVTRIVLDPGHGGGDNGSVGPSGLKEADVCWQVCQLLKSRIEQSTNLEVFLTRRMDEGGAISNSVRVARANSAQGHLLVSLHCGAGLFPQQSGQTVFYPSAQAGDENQSESQAMEILSGADVGQQSTLIPWKLAGRPYQSATVRLAGKIYERMRIWMTEREEVPRAAFIELLQSVQMPAVLVELGVISNPKDEEKLRQKGYQKELAEALYMGITNFIREQEQYAGQQ
ncbi:MAG TPA: N-acetylmuramoyl-L-alanine amidase, partial [bacterium]|nr:N-acetylmuramoyl-L-alanine amidase [bacterium]